MSGEVSFVKLHPQQF